MHSVLRTTSGLEKYVKNTLLSQNMVGKELCEVYYCAGRDVEQIMKWLLFKNEEINHFSLKLSHV